METDEWISCKDRLPPDNVHVIAKNPHVVAESWIDGVDEPGKPSWCHRGWEHADGYVTHWKPMECEFCNEEHFVLYGICRKCGRKGNPPLMDIDIPILGIK